MNINMKYKIIIPLYIVISISVLIIFIQYVYIPIQASIPSYKQVYCQIINIENDTITWIYWNDTGSYTYKDYVESIQSYKLYTIYTCYIYTNNISTIQQPIINNSVIYCQLGLSMLIIMIIFGLCVLIFSCLLQPTPVEILYPISDIRMYLLMGSHSRVGNKSPIQRHFFQSDICERHLINTILSFIDEDTIKEHEISITSDE